MPVQSRKKTFLFSGIANYAAIIVSSVIALVSIPIGLHYFGPVLYGIWFVIGSILAYLRIADLGVGLSTLTLMAQTSNHSHHRVILSRSISLLLVVSIVAFGTIIAVTHAFPGWWGILGQIPPNLQDEAATAALAICILTLFQLPTTIFPAAFSGLQQVYWNRAYGAFHSVVGLCALLATVSVGGNLVTLAILTGLGSLLVGIISGFHLFIKHPQIRPRFREQVTEAPSTKFLFSSGIRFLFLGIAALVIMSTDNLVISHFLGPEMVTPYAVTFKLFFTCLLIVNGTTIALWPMYGQAFGRNDWSWIQQTYNHVTFLHVLGGGLIWIGGIIFAQVIINLWVGPVAYGGIVVVFALGGYVYISSFTGSNVNLVNGLNPTNIVVIFGLIEAALNLGISLALIGPLGIGGVALGTLIASSAVNSWFHPLYIQHRTLKKVTLDTQPFLTHLFVVILCVILAMFTVFYASGDGMRIAMGAVIISSYLALSWWVMPRSLQILTKETFREYYKRAKTFLNMKICQ